MLSLCFWHWQRGKQSKMAVSEEDLQKVLQVFQNAENKDELLHFVMVHYPQLILRSPAHRDVALLDGSKFFRLILGAMEFAIFPHARSPELSHLVGITTRQSSWHWVVNQIRVHVPDPTWVHAANLTLLSKVFAKMSSRWVVANFRCTLRTKWRRNGLRFGGS